MDERILSALSAYCQEADKFCSLISVLQKESEQNYSKIAQSIAHIYAQSLNLPDVEPDEDECYRGTPTAVSNLFGENDFYWEIYDPYELSEPVGGTISEDLFSIYDDLKTGLELYKNKRHAEAAWHWNFSFRYHWSYHAVDALRAINKLAME